MRVLARKLLRIVAAVTIGLPVLLVVLVGLYGLMGQPGLWPAPLTGVRLEPWRPLVRESDIGPDNAFRHLLGRRRLDPWPADVRAEYEAVFLHDQWPAEFPAMQRWIREHEDFFDAWDRFGSETNCVIPTAEDARERRWDMGEGRQCKWFLHARTAPTAARGDWIAMSDLWTKTIQAGQNLTRGGPLLARGIGQSMAFAVCRDMRLRTERSAIDPSVGTVMIAFLRRTEEAAEPLAEAVRYDRIAIRNEMVRPDFDQGPDRFVEFDRWEGPFVKCMACLGGGVRVRVRNADSIYSRIIHGCELPYPNDMAEQIHSIEMTSTGARFRRVLDPVTYAFLFYVNAGEQFDRIHFPCDLRGTRTFLAVRLYQAEHDGRPPARLSDLVPRYLDAVPMDPFTGDREPLKYRLGTDGTWSVYAVGPNGLDDGGLFDWRTDFDHREQADFAFHSDELRRMREPAEAALRARAAR